MKTLNQIEDEIIKMHKEELINWCMNNQLIHREKKCSSCQTPMKLSSYLKNDDLRAWRCINNKCIFYKRYFSIRNDTFFDGFRLPLLVIIKVLIKYASKTGRRSIIEHFKEFDKEAIYKIIKKLTSKIPSPNFSDCKLGGPGRIVQVDETMLNYKCKSHRGRSSENKTDALCIVEVNENIKRVYATIIEDKKATTIIPIICSQVASNSVIWTDEHKSYSQLCSLNYIHDTVCHKYTFINNSNGVNTQAVESFNSLIKYEIKKRKGILTKERKYFLNEVCWLFNNDDNIFKNIINLLKI